MKAHACAAAAVLAALVAGCKPPAPPLSTAPPVAIAQDTPTSAATSLLRVLQAHLQAQAAWQYGAADQYRDQAIAELLDQSDILARYRAVAGSIAKPDREALHALVENWAAAIAFYADDIRHEQAAAREGREGNRAIVVVPAFAGADQANIQLALARDADGRWRAVGLEFGKVEAAATRPTTASTPASVPSGTHP